MTLLQSKTTLNSVHSVPFQLEHVFDRGVGQMKAWQYAQLILTRVQKRTGGSIAVVSWNGRWFEL
jgi:hypothetical protein